MPPQQPLLRIEAGMHTGLIRRIDVSADGRMMVTSSQDKTLRLWSLPDARLLKIFRVPIGPREDGRLYAVALSPDGRIAAAGGWDASPVKNSGGSNHVYLFDTVSGAIIARLGPLPNVMYDLAFSPDGRRLAAGLWGTNGIRMWTAPFASPPAEDKQYGDTVYSLDFDATGRLAASSWDGSIRLYDAELKLIGTSKAPGGAQPHGIAFSPDSRKLAVAYADGPRVDILDARNLTLSYSADTSFTAGQSGNVAWSADGKTLYAGGTYLAGNGVSVVAWPEEGRGPAMFLGGPTSTIMDLASLAGGGVAFASQDPAFGIFTAEGTFRTVLDAQGKPANYREAVVPDMRGKVGGMLVAAPDGMGVWFGLKAWAEQPWRFDLARFTFEPSPALPPGYVAPRTRTLPVAGWFASTYPTVDSVPLGLESYELSRSLAIAPNNESFVLGAEWSLYRFTKRGEYLWRTITGGTVWGVNLSADGEIVIAALGDGTIRWYRTVDGAELLALFVHVPDKRWIVWTPSGYYAASPGAEDLIGWHANGKTWTSPVDFFPASRFRDRFYRPDIVQLVLKLKDERKAVEEANSRARRRVDEEPVRQILPAVVEIIADPRGIDTGTSELTLSYRLRSPSGRPITKLEARIDDRPVESRAAVPLAEEGEHELTIHLPPRDLELSLIAYIQDQPGAPAKIQVRWKGRPAAAKPKLHALLIGVSDYDDTNLKLGFASKDARDLVAALEAQKGRQYGDVEIVSLLDKDARRKAVLTELAKLQSKVGPEDFAIVFMAGHGLTDDALDFYYLPSDGSADPLLYDASDVSGLVINNMLSKIRGKVLLFMDTCRSGSAAVASGRVDMGKAANDMAQGGLVVLASSTGRQDSLESAAWNNGAFTYAMLQTLNDAKAYGDDGVLDIYELAGEVSRRVMKLTEGRQIPVMANYGPLFTLASLQ